jgi:hypothetical protein
MYLHAGGIAIVQVQSAAASFDFPGLRQPAVAFLDFK